MDIQGALTSIDGSHCIACNDRNPYSSTVVSRPCDAGIGHVGPGENGNWSEF